MKTLSKLILALCVTAAGVVVAQAQIDTGVTVRANIPFAFVAGEKSFPAGEYEITPVEGMSGVVELRSVRGKRATVFNTDNALTEGNRPSANTELVFNQFGDQSFLSQVWVAGSLNGSTLPESKMEKELAGQGQVPERHRVAAALRKMKL